VTAINILQELKKAGICFAVIRKWDKIETEKEIDILLAKNDMQKTLEVLKAYGPLGVVQDGHHIGVYVPKIDKKFDFHMGFIGWNGIKFIDGDAALSETASFKGIPVLNSAALTASLIVHIIFDKKVPSDEYASIILKNSAVLKKAINMTNLPLFLKKEIRSKIEKKDFDFKKTKFKAIAWLVLKGKVLTLFWNWKTLKKVFRVLNPFWFAPTIVFIGPDGVGKTTVISEIKKQFRNAKYVRLGIYNSRTKIVHAISKVRKHKRVNAPCWIKNLVRFFDMYARWFRVLWHTKTGKMVLCDRFFFDLHYYSECKKFTEFLLKLSPKPSLTFLLTAEPKEIHRRKQEKTVKELEEMLFRMKRLAKERGFKEIENRELNKTVQAIKTEILLGEGTYKFFFDKISE